MANAYLDNGRQPGTARKELTVCFEFVSSHFLLDNYASVSSLVRVALRSAVSLCNCDSLSACLLGACRLLLLVLVGSSLMLGLFV